MERCRKQGGSDMETISGGIVLFGEDMKAYVR